MNGDLPRFQSTHPCGVRHLVRVEYYAFGKVSIHAPLWGATLHTSISPLQYPSFNPRTPVGCDAQFGEYPLAMEFVSIHAPLWGATSTGTFPDSKPSLFQSTHPCGVRQVAGFLQNFGLKKFQSTHPCGVRLTVFFHKPVTIVFQSTHPCGVRLGF